MSKTPDGMDFHAVRRFSVSKNLSSQEQKAELRRGSSRGQSPPRIESNDPQALRSKACGEPSEYFCLSLIHISEPTRP